MESARRVLADKTTNTSMRRQTSTKSAVRSAGLGASFGLPASPSKGQKRSFEDFEEQGRDESQNSNATHALSDSSSLCTDEDAQDTDTAPTRSTGQTTVMSFHASQAEPNPIEAEFEIHDEMSQQTLDKIHAVTLPQNASQSFLRPALTKDTSIVSVSMSSFIDFDQERSTEASDDLRPIDEDRRQGDTGIPVKTKEEQRKDLLNERAAALRTRLGLAFYKVRTDQTMTHFSRLAVPAASKTAQTEAEPEFQSSPPSSPPRPASPLVSPESRAAIMRARAAMQAKPPVASLNRLAMPRIVPTAYSNKWAREAAEVLCAGDTPSSPPVSNCQPSTCPQSGTPPPQTRNPRENRVPQTPRRLSTPPGSPGQAKSTVQRLKSAKYNGLTSSVVKGEAASSLLELGKGGIE